MEIDKVRIYKSYRTKSMTSELFKYLYLFRYWLNVKDIIGLRSDCIYICDELIELEKKKAYNRFVIEKSTIDTECKLNKDVDDLPIEYIVVVDLIYIDNQSGQTDERYNGVAVEISYVDWLIKSILE